MFVKLQLLGLVLCAFIVVTVLARRLPVQNDDKAEKKVPKVEDNGNQLSFKVHSHGPKHNFEFPEKHNGSFVGFTAWVQSEQSFERDDVVFFDGVLVNEGGYYQPTLGRFTCPFDGVYFVAVTYKTVAPQSGIDDTEYIVVDVVPDQEEQKFLYSYNDNNLIPRNTVSNSGITMCAQGEHISVIARYPMTIFGEPGIPQSTFTVFMMHSRGESFHDDFVGFSASAAGQSYVNGDLIVFDDVYLNEGGHYVPELSRFQCPVTGIYYTTLNVISYSSNSAHAMAVDKNSVGILYLVDFVEDDNILNTVSNSRLFECEEGEILSVKATGSGTVVESPYSTFSVMLMQQQTTKLNQKHISFDGFTVSKKSSQSYTVGETIRFDGYLLNEGGHFDPVLSRFVCPVAGIYYVALTCRKVEGNNLVIDIEYETTTLFRLEDSEAENRGNTLTNSALTRCFSGEVIVVKGAGTGQVYGIASEPQTTFTAMLMYQY